MRKLNRWLYGSGLFALLLFLAGCVKTGKNGQPTGDGIVYNLLVQPMSNMITYLVNHFNWNYGWAIIVITIVVRIIILPLGLYQSHKSLVQSEKMQALKPQLDIAQSNLKQAKTQEEQLNARADMQRVYKENNVSMVGGIGCLPLLIQMPIFSALFFAAKYTKGITQANFLGISLGKPSLVFVALAGAAYLLQGYLSTIGIPEEQKKTMKSMLIVSPLMIVFMSFSSPAGVALYWVVGGIFTCIQTFITNVLMRPKIKAKIEEDLKNNPPKQVVFARKDITADKSKEDKTTKNKSSKKNNSTNGRNAGKQKRNTNK
ncbi:membrane protein insertase YidC [Melissococcus plutonius]|uniref:Membrane protein insertase YidC n=1 Tax=Melissococcus plutonius (strain ATCC 35311 / DSM 29964 / CIP 104052 / LMG 20360 / NCIMB 702443) TaxID=940190 RepID=F3YAZ7_MELPT|nr:membrane protein insertase YidC [Melissococcus plutonius]AIM25110.1 membrane protein insertase YidC [Melissococcus plutonius S1]KMT25353.1 membrane protein insertase YidC [Melissococcus plutonius]KMT25622.1 membrane protein insertase YidC [Melissococcus plutonius]KMT26257.1 membrane protein insertase YidC [Melissococcus plutonius]KMT28999.1 membrane protein insertase YidC [Melissococcus plutonius]